MSDATPVDLAEHARQSEIEYRRLREQYARLAEVVGHVLSAGLRSVELPYHSINGRAKALDSFAAKAAKPLESDPRVPRYPRPLEQITDLAGVRVIVFVPGALATVDTVIRSEFSVLEATDKGQELIDGDRFGYQSIHYLVRLTSERLKLPEYAQFAGLVAEIQARTILQHAWAELEHDIRYKSTVVIPLAVRRRFGALAGMLEIADREFQAIQDEDEGLREAARSSVTEGRLDEVEVTPDALKSYLDKKLGPDGRMTSTSYEALAIDLRHLGFANLRELDDAIANYDDDRISRIVWGSRQGQIWRLEDMLHVAMGDNYPRLHRWQNTEFWLDRHRQVMDRLTAAGIMTRNYCPSSKISPETPNER